jgi:hypothetical protein
MEVEFLKRVNCRLLRVRHHPITSRKFPKSRILADLKKESTLLVPPESYEREKPADPDNLADEEIQCRRDPVLEE